MSIAIERHALINEKSTKMKIHFSCYIWINVLYNINSWGPLSSLLKSKFLYLSMHWSMVIRDQQAENDEPKNENENVDDNK